MGRINPDETSQFYKLTHKKTSGRTKPPTGIAGGNDLKWRHNLHPESQATRVRQNVATHEAMSEWLLTFPWQWYATLTFSKSISAAGAHLLFRQYMRWAEGAAGVPVYAFRADEYGELNGRFHIHALVGNVGSLKPYCGDMLPAGVGRSCCATHGWMLTSRRCGYARVFPFTPEKGAAFYVTKYVTKANGDWELYGDPQIQQTSIERKALNG